MGTLKVSKEIRNMLEWNMGSRSSKIPSIGVHYWIYPCRCARHSLDAWIIFFNELKWEYYGGDPLGAGHDNVILPPNSGLLSVLQYHFKWGLNGDTFSSIQSLLGSKTQKMKIEDHQDCLWMFTFRTGVPAPLLVRKKTILILVNMSGLWFQTCFNFHPVK